jgi:hypothetical protein
MQQFIATQKSQTIVVESRSDKSYESETKCNNDMLCLLLAGGDVDFSSPGTFKNQRTLTYTQAMKNILLQPTMIRAVLAVDILTTVFSDIPDNMAERLSPLTTHKKMYHISKNFDSALINCNFQQTNLDSLSYKTNSITILSLLNRAIL